MYRKEDVRFPAEGGIELSAWVFVPEHQNGALPAITMAHGYAGTKYHGIEPAAQAFAEAGFVVLVHAHRCFGDSEGEPRQDVNPWQQITDWRRAISYLQSRKEVDENRIGLWGTSYSGGHAIILGATDRRIKAVVSQAPTIDGFAAGLRRVSPEAVADLEAQFAADERAQLRGEAPATQVIVTAAAATTACYRAADAVSFYLRPVPPLLMIVARHDHIAVTDLALKAYERALEPKRLVMIEGGHFAPYLGEFETASRVAIDWFKTHLL